MGKTGDHKMRKERIIEHDMLPVGITITAKREITLKIKEKAKIPLREGDEFSKHFFEGKEALHVSKKYRKGDPEFEFGLTTNEIDCLV